MTNEEATYGWCKSFRYVAKRLNGVLFLLAASLFANVANAEITITTQNLRIVTGVKIVGGQVHIDDGSKLAVVSVCTVGVTSPAKFIDLVARRFVIRDGVVIVENATVTSVGTRQYQIQGVGGYSVEVTAFDPITGIDRKSTDITIANDPVVPDASLTGLSLDARNAILGLTQGMATDMHALSLDVARGKYKTVLEASAASNVSDEVTRTVFKRTMAKNMQPLLGSTQLPADAPKIFEDIATGFRSVK